MTDCFGPMVTQNTRAGACGEEVHLLHGLVPRRDSVSYSSDSTSGGGTSNLIQESMGNLQIQMIP